ncbi:carbohydrate kinase family protein [Ancrocorticia populi]|uniref:carbohydrate kinase family protein n=1 Tax=Ancrocorticia populi TaxID=2175228 RepID=UPI002353200D|nr:carbohydrate kinase family protein [Ancrocorticia populi]
MRAVVIGPLFLDVIFTGLERLPHAGEELWSDTCEITAGGAANQARALARLGVHTSLCSYVGQDSPGRLVRSILADDDVSHSLLAPIPRQAVTAAMSLAGDRAMVSNGSNEAPPLSGPAPDLLMGDLRALAANSEVVARWRAAGTLVIADVGWDESGVWSLTDLEPLALADVFVPNEDEARAYTRTESAEAAAAALVQRVPHVVVTRGADGCVGADSHAVTSIPAFPAKAIDATGAGDVFSAALGWALLDGADLREAMRAASVAGGLATEAPGGTGAPTVEELRAADL